MTRNLHIIKNDKFDPSPIFEATDSKNTYVCELQTTDEPIYFLNKDLVMGLTYEGIVSLLKKGEYDNVFFHPLRENWYDLVLAVPDDKNVIWCVFGVELYSNKFLSRFIKERMSIYLPETEKWVIAHGYKTPFRLKSFIKNLIKRPIYRRRCREAIKRVNYVAPIFANEMELLQQIRGFRAKYFPFQYTRWSVNNDFGCKSKENGQYILLGNSGYPVNNHLDALKVLKERGIINRKLYLPMAYGDAQYKDKVRKSLDGMGFCYTIQETMIPYLEYQRVVKACDVVIIPSVRQHASDTIYMNLLQGAKVYLYENSVAYKFLTSEGIKVFSIEKDISSISITEDLPQDVIQSNRQKVLELVSIEKTVERLQIALDNI